MFRRACGTIDNEGFLILKITSDIPFLQYAI